MLALVTSINCRSRFHPSLSQHRGRHAFASNSIRATESIRKHMRDAMAAYCLVFLGIYGLAES